MPIMRRCSNSGALIFDLTPEEQEVQDLKTDLNDKIALLDDKLAELDKVLKANKKPRKV